MSGIRRKGLEESFKVDCLEAEMTQLDSKIISSLRTVLEDVCGHLPATSVTARIFVAGKILECAHQGERTYDGLLHAARRAVVDARRG
jgi:hypothetical protein